MITLCRDTERRHVKRGKQDTWLTLFTQERPGSLAENFGFLAIFSEMLLPPDRGAAPYPREEAEIITYVHKGTIAQEDSTGRSGVIHAGEFQRMTTGRDIRHKERNASRNDWAHIFRISLHPSVVGLDCTHEQEHFTAAQRRNVLCVVASQDGRNGSMRTRQDALICSSILDPGHHLVHELKPGRSAWLHVVNGEAALDDMVLTKGDGVGVSVKPSVSLTVQENTEILLIESGPATNFFGNGESP